MDVAAFAEAAHAAADPIAWAYLAGGSGDEVTVNDNMAAWRRWRLRPHVLRDVSEISTATTVLGQPSRPRSSWHPRPCTAGSTPTARAPPAAPPGRAPCTACRRRRPRRRGHRRRRARWPALDAGVRAARPRAHPGRVRAGGRRRLPGARRHRRQPRLSRRSRLVDRSTFGVPGGLALPNLAPGDPAPDLFAVVEGYDPAARPDDLHDARRVGRWPSGGGEGSCEGDDARAAMDAGAAAIVVSNHGGRQLDTASRPPRARPRWSPRSATRPRSTSTAASAAAATS